MRPLTPGNRDVITGLMPHINSAIKTSPCACADLDVEAMLNMILDHGLDTNTRVTNFLALSNTSEIGLRKAIYGKMKDPALRPLLIKTLQQYVPDADIERHNSLLNHVFQECGLAENVRVCGQIAVAHTALLRYLWTFATSLTRFTHGEGEPANMLELMRLFSTTSPFVSTSITKSPWFETLDTFYTIRVTDAHRKRATPVTYTSAFAINDQETLGGFASYLYFEDEVRIENGTPIEPGTADMTFLLSATAPKSGIDRLVSKHSPPGTVSVRRL